MDLPWGDERTVQFITNVGLVTSRGPYGDNVMACEWTHHVSYSPGLIMACIGRNKATEANILKSKEFGVSLAATEQAKLASIAGNNSGKAVDKVKALQELGFPFYPAKKIGVLMVQDAVLNIECKLIKKISIGDHTLFIGEVLDAVRNPGKEPLAYHHLQYWKMTEQLLRPSEEEKEKIKTIIGKHKRANKTFLY